MTQAQVQTPTAAATKATAEKIDALTRRAQALNERRTRAVALLEAEEQRAQEASALAKEKFGTSDLDELRRQFADEQSKFDQEWFDFELELNQLDSLVTQAEAALKSV